MRLLDLTFSDLFVGPTLGWSWYRKSAGSRESVSVPEAHEAELRELREYLIGLSGPKDFRIAWPRGEEKAVKLRVKRKAVDDGITLFILRRFTFGHELSLSNTGLQRVVVSHLLSDHEMLKGGAIGFFGSPGSGKTTTASAFVLDRIRRFGGTAWTIENPIELNLQGKHEKGWVYQSEVSDDDDIGQEIREIYRVVPDILFIGEVRTAEAACEVVRAAGSGYLTVFTFHANSIPSGVGQFARLVAEGKSTEISASFADVLRAAIHLKLHEPPIDVNTRSSTLVSARETGTGEPPLILAAQPLFLIESEGRARSILRSGDYQLLLNEMDQQRRTLMANNPVF